MLHKNVANIIIFQNLAMKIREIDLKGRLKGPPLLTAARARSAGPRACFISILYLQYSQYHPVFEVWFSWSSRETRLLATEWWQSTW